MIIDSDRIRGKYNNYSLMASPSKEPLAMTLMHPDEESDVLFLVEFSNAELKNLRSRLFDPINDDQMVRHEFVCQRFESILAGTYSWDSALQSVKNRHKEGKRIFQEWHNYDKSGYSINSKMYIRAPNIKVYHWMRNESFNGMQFVKRIRDSRYITLAPYKKTLDSLGITDIEDYFTDNSGTIQTFQHRNLMRYRISFDSVDDLLSFSISQSKKVEALGNMRHLTVTMEDALYLT